MRHCVEEGWPGGKKTKSSLEKCQHTSPQMFLPQQKLYASLPSAEEHVTATVNICASSTFILIHTGKTIYFHCQGWEMKCPSGYVTRLSYCWLQNTQ